MKRRVIVLSTGGTIASTPDASGRSVSGALSGEALARQLTLPESLTLDVHSILQKPSNAIEPSDLLMLRAQCIEQAAAQGVAGIVITHGTDTLEDTAFFLQCTLPHDFCPVVVTGSQRVPHALGSDALTNLASAITVAAHPGVWGCGVLVVFNETIFSASTARKVSTYRVNGFDAPGYGSLGGVDGDVVWVRQKPELPWTIEPGPSLPRVDLHSVALGVDPALVFASIETGAKGLVLDGVGRGHVPPQWMPAIQQAIAHKLPVVITSSCLHGPLAQAYEFEGSLFSLESLGVVPANHLSARKARMRLMAFLSSTDRNMSLADLYVQASSTSHGRKK